MELEITTFKMASLIPLLLLIVGFVALILGANWLVNGATSVGIRAKLSPFIIGLTIVAFGTSSETIHVL